MKKSYWERFLYGMVTFLILSCAYIWIKEPWIGADTIEYLGMHAYLPPLYPLFMRGLKIIFGEVTYTYVAVFIQTCFAAWIVAYLLELLSDTFKVNKFTKKIIFILLLLTYFKVDEYDPNCNLWILTEGLSYSLFYVFVYYSILFLKKKTYKIFVKLTCSTVLLILCRTQFIVCIGMLILYISFLLIMKKIDIKKVCCLIGISLMGMLCINLFQVGYRQIADRTNIKMFHLLSLGTHLYYYSQKEDAAKIEDESEKQLFLDIYYDMSYNGYGYEERRWLDNIKQYRDSFPYIYNMTALKIRGYVSQMNIKDTTEADEVASQILNRQIEAMRTHFWMWTWDALKQLPASLARVIALYYEPLQEYCIGYVVVLYGLYFIVNILLIIQTKKIQIGNLLCIFQVIFTLANAIVSQMAIRSIMRYLAYTFGLFYISGLLVFLELYKGSRFSTGHQV